MRMIHHKLIRVLANPLKGLAKTRRGEERRGDGRGQDGGTTLEWAMLLGFVAFPSFLLIRMALEILVEYYRLGTFVNSLPFP